MTQDQTPQNSAEAVMREALAVFREMYEHGLSSRTLSQLQCDKFRVAIDNLAALAASPAHATGAAMREAWADAYKAFVGAFDTAVGRRKRNDDYAQDARARMRAFNDMMLAALSSPAPEGEAAQGVEPVAWLVTGNGWKELCQLEKHAKSLATSHDAAVTPLFALAPPSVKQEEAGRG